MANTSGTATFVFTCRNTTFSNNMKLITLNGAYTSGTQQATQVHRSNQSSSNCGTTVVSTSNTSGVIYNVNRIPTTTTSFGSITVSDGVKDVG